METFFFVKKYRRYTREFYYLAIRAIPGFPKYVPDSESYHKSYYLTNRMDSTLDCYESEVAAVADLPRSTAELIFIRQRHAAPPAFQIESMQLALAAIALSVDAACRPLWR